MMGRFGGNAIEEIKQRADLAEVIGAHVRLRRVGRNFVGLCPFHNEKTPSFSVSPERGFFHCFGCGAGGTVFNFVMRMEGLSFPEAVRSLGRRYGVAPAELGESGPGAAERDAFSRANQLAAEFFFHVLWNTADGAAAREYLAARGIAAESARAFMLGFAPARPTSLAGALERRSLTEPGLKLGLVKRGGAGLYDAFRSRVMFPIRDVQGRVLAFGGRVLDGRQPKYLNSPESPLYSKARTLYGLYEARGAVSARERAFLVEGYFDVIALWQAGFKETVASCGTSLTTGQLRVLSRYTKNVIACFDGDEAGRKASLRALEVFLEAGLLGRAMFIPPGFDPDTLVRARGAQALEELAEAAELLVDYFLREQARAASTSVAGRARAAECVAETLKRVTNPFEFDLLARKAAGLLGVGEETLRRAARARTSRAHGAQGGAAAGARTAPAAGDAAAKAELGVIAIALLCPALRAELRAECPAGCFADAALGALFEELCSPTGAADGAERLIAERLSPAQQGQLGELALSALPDDPERARGLAADYVAAMAQRGRRRRIEELKRVAAGAPGTGGVEEDAAAAAVQEVVTLNRDRERGRPAGSS